ncbi:hypothetical protein MCUN1_000951 [Malassezia cuniculi]|uniref:Tubulin-specific chaperone D n=1 Tax=Malassezia cuniculi TaxID=948313 RepID=A0AAF0ES96_9BASI|nr:hypothetical protein MCUN1_000951 [Malassezia cuniculi]
MGDACDASLDAEVAELVSFQDKHGFLEAQEAFITEALSNDIAAAEHSLRRLEARLDVYQEQPYLLDPVLAELVTPPAKAVQKYVRGPKVVLLFFTNNVDDLLPVLNLLETAAPAAWHVIYVLILWLALICLVPFSLNDIASTEQVENVARDLLARPGRERDAAATLLGNLYRRRDVGSVHFFRFLDWARERLRSGSSAFEATGILQTLCTIAKNGDASFVQTHVDDMAALLDEYIPLGRQNTLIDRYRAKLSCRLALRIIEHNSMPNNVDERVDVLVDELICAVQHPDSAVRYSGAKGIARICAKIPRYFAAQVINVVIELMASNIPNVPAAVMSGTAYDPDVQGALDAAQVDAVSDSTWNGALLALAEVTRRALVPADMLTCAMYFVLRALFFEQRRGLGAIGTNVRDAACYVLWAAARLRVDDLKPVSQAVSARLAVVMTLDREVTIRRAASAAFQEWVGRTSLVPHGIEAMKETDFAAVGIRRNAYLVCAPFVARFSNFMPEIHSHLVNSCLSHWDVSVRTLGAQAAAEIAAAHEELLPLVLEKHRKAARSLDSAAVHGSLCAVHQLALRMQVPCAVEIVVSVSPKMHVVHGVSLIIASACTAAASGWQQGDNARYIDDMWQLVRTASRRPEGDVHKAVCELVYALRHEASADAYITTTATATCDTVEEERCVALAFGALASTHADQVVTRLISMADSSDAEARANSAASLGAVGRHVSDEHVMAAVDKLTDGLHDYAVDERGDVGSWVRIASMKALGDIITLRTVPNEAVQKACAAMSTQLVERIDTVRTEAAVQLARIAGRRDVPGRDMLAGLSHRPASFAQAIPLLDVAEYRLSLLRGLAHTIGGLSATLGNEAANALLAAMPSARAVFGGISRLAASSVRDNREFVALLRTAYYLIQDGRAYAGISDALAHLVRLASISPDKIKSMPRLLACARFIAGAIQYGHGVDSLSMFLGHKYPAVRLATSEALCISMQLMEPNGKTAAAEELLLRTEWGADESAARQAACEIMAILH